MDEMKYEWVQALLDCGGDPNCGLWDNFSLLFWASESGHTEVTKLLLDAGANPNFVEINGWTSVLAASANNHADVVNLLLGAGADPNFIGKDGHTPLLMASANNHTDVVRLLLDAGANFNVISPRFTTPFSHAMNYENEEMMKLLLYAGVEPIDTIRTHFRGRNHILLVDHKKALGLLAAFPRVVTLVTLCLRIIRKNQICRQFIPPVVFEHPDEVEQERVYRKRRRDFEENSPNKRT